MQFEPRPVGFINWIFSTQWHAMLIIHALVIYGFIAQFLEPIEELGWAILVPIYLLAIVFVYWFGNYIYWRVRLRKLP